MLNGLSKMLLFTKYNAQHTHALAYFYHFVLTVFYNLIKLLINTIYCKFKFDFKVYWFFGTSETLAIYKHVWPRHHSQNNKQKETTDNCLYKFTNTHGTDK